MNRPASSASAASNQAAQAITPELRDWVWAQVAAGHAPDAVLQAMVVAGWQEDVALQALELTLQTPARQPQVAQPSAQAATQGPVPEPDLGAAPSVLDAGDRQVAVLLTLERPRVVVFGGFLSDAECDALVAAARPRLARSLTVETRTGGEAVNADRTSQGMFFRRAESELVARIETRIARLLRWPLENGEGLQVLHYQPGAQYKPHHDYFDPAAPGTATLLKRGGQRVGTLVMYLNTPARGGATTFPDVGMAVAAQRGNAVFFSYDRPHPATQTLHGGAPVLAGEKWVATKWLRQSEFI